MDANGNAHAYYSAGVSGTTPFADYSHTSVTVTNPQGQTVYSYTAGYDNNMSGTTITDGAGTVVETKVYGDPNDPYRPSQVMDGIASNMDPAVTPGSDVTFKASGTDAPAAGTWDIVLNQAIVATSAAPNGWTVSIDTGYGRNNFTVGAPVNATVADGYEVRDNTPMYGHPVYYSGIFDVIAPGTIRKGTTYYTWDQFGNMQTGTTARATTTTDTWSYTNFTLGELTKTQEGSESPTSYTYYEPSGNIHTVVSPLPGTVGSAQTVTTTYNWDALGNLTSIVSPGNNSATTFTTTLRYTTDGTYNQPEALGEPITITDNLGKVSHRRYDARSNQIQAVDEIGYETDWTFNLADQPLTIEFPATGQTGTGHATFGNTYLYAGGPLLNSVAKDESGAQVREITAEYGAEGELLSMSGSTQPITYTFDADYRTASTGDGSNHLTSYQYDLAGYPASITYPDGKSVQFPLYDDNGDCLKRVDANNVETDYVYSNPESLLTAIQYPATPAINVRFSYDQYGRREAMTDSTGSATYSYDDLDDVLTAATTYTGLPQQTISYAYYPDGSRQTMTTPAGTFSYGFDGDGRPNSLSNPYSETSQWSYLDNGWLWTQKLGNGAPTFRTYNARGFLTRLQNETSASAILSDFGEAGGMQYDSLGNLTSMPVNIPGSTAGTGTSNFTYNTQDELTQEASGRNGNYTNGFGYDAAFNPTTFKGVTHTFNADNQDNLISYDGNGNPTAYDGNGTTFDPENRMTAYGSLLTAGYTGDNLRAWKQTTAGRTYFLFDGAEPVVELNSAGAVTAVNTFGADGLLSRHTAGGSVFYQFDPQGSVTQRLDASQNVLSTLVFDAFGKELAGGSAGEPWGYGAQAGYYTDPETGLELLTQRYYDPSAGRFLNRDPISYNGGANLYGYVANGPIRYEDPSGTLAPVPAPVKPPVPTPDPPGIGIIGKACIYVYFFFCDEPPAGSQEDTVTGWRRCHGFPPEIHNGKRNPTGGHDSNRRKSNKGGHDAANKRRKMDAGGEKADPGRGSDKKFGGNGNKKRNNDYCKGGAPGGGDDRAWGVGSRFVRLWGRDLPLEWRPSPL